MANTTHEPKETRHSATIIAVVACVGLSVVLRMSGAFGQDKFTPNRDWKGGREHYEKLLLDFAVSKAAKESEKLTELFDAYNRCRYFALLEKEGGDRDPLVDWLLGNPDFCARLFSSFGPEDDPTACLEVVRGLRSDFGDKITEVGNLVIAFAIVWDKFSDSKASRGESFAYFYNNRKLMKSDFDKMPYELLKHIANTSVTIEERMWALKTYSSRARKGSEIGKVFFDVPWGMRYFVGGKGQQGNLPYTLPNIKKYGGVCVDQAYFAANVVKSLGIPAEVFSGFGVRGGHAWIGYVKRDEAGGLYWDLGTARYSYDRYFTGYSIDPQTGKQITDHDVAVDCRSWTLPREKIDACRHYVELSVLVDPETNKELGIGLVDLALKVNPYSRSAWDRMADYCKAGVAGKQKINKMFDFLLTAFPKHPDFSFNAFSKFIEVVPPKNVKQRLSLYDALFALYSKRPDLAVGVRQLKGKYLIEQGMKREGFEVYRDTIMEFMKRGNLLGDLAPSVADDYVEEGHPETAITMLNNLLKYVPKPEDIDPFASASVYVRLKLKLRELYEKAGKQDIADKIAKELEPFLKDT